MGKSIGIAAHFQDFGAYIKGVLMEEDDIDYDRIDDAVLALMYLTWHDVDRFTGLARAWKSFDWDAMNRLYEKEMIFDPVSKAKSVGLTKEGVERSEALFKQMFLRG